MRTLTWINDESDKMTLPELEMCMERFDMQPAGEDSYYRTIPHTQQNC
jgi:hypothetical protein